MKDIFSAHLDCEHPARKNREVWEAAFAQVIENFEAQRVLVEEQLVLYYDFHGLKLETIYAILDLKELAPSSTWDPESKKYLEGLIATAKEKFEEAGGKPKDAQSLARYLARGQIDRMNDLNKATTLTLEERKKIAHVSVRFIWTKAKPILII